MRKPGNVGGERPSPSFLTQEQREALDAALLKKRAEQRECRCTLAGSRAMYLGGDWCLYALGP
jgi:hypothetical protein